MIDFRRKEMVPSSTVAVSSILVLFGTFVFMAYAQFINPPTTKGLAERVRKDSLKTQLATKLAKESAAAAEATIEANTWEGTRDVIDPAAMTKLRAIARKNGITMTAFRPQKEATAGSLTALPYVLTLQGPFPSVVKFTQQVDKPGTKLSVNLVQVNASSEENNSVVATVGVTAYIKPGVEAAKPSTTANSKSASGRSTGV